ncbi:MAG: 50S ribosomal protein L11 methyltransferase [Saprospiraceae bacterium]|nr:50S ribosomal protein L11 methyltransferase [Saprospiraceae bacterium]
MDIYQTEELELDIAGIPIKILQITNVDDLYERLIAKGEGHEDVQDERIPYWAELWPAAIGLSEHLVKSNVIKPGMTVLEIGCGLGLPGIIATKLGANVILTDYLEEALTFAKCNSELNNLNEIKFNIMDWRNPSPILAADIILASDITYEKRFFEFLPNAFRTLCKPGGSIIVSDPDREAAKDFFDSIENEGFTKQLFTYDVRPLLGGKNVTIKVFHLQPK